MKEVLIIGSGIAGLSSAVSCASRGMHVTLVSPFPSERAQSVMAAGGINAVLKDCEEGDSVESHIEDTIKGGSGIAGEKAVRGLCENAQDVIRYLEGIGTVFTLDADGKLARRAFGGQSHKRTCFCGTSTGKQIVSALVMEARRFEARGMITRRLSCGFYEGLISDGACFGAVLFNMAANRLENVYADALIIATGGQNALFGKTTGSTQCDGYAAGKLYMQGAKLKNLEFIQYHPTAIETAQKRMLISEAVRGEGGRLFYIENGKRVYFMEDKYGARGNLMTRDVVSREIYACGKDVFLDISFLDRKTIESRLAEVQELCLKYRGLDITKEPIPVSPSVHFFMGGLAVHLNHETNIRNLYAVGECASIYHGANRLGGNSLLAAVYSGRVAAASIAERKEEPVKIPAAEFDAALAASQEKLLKQSASESSFPVMYIRDMLAQTMQEKLGIVRSAQELESGTKDVDYYLSVSEKLRYDSTVSAYYNYTLPAILTLAKAIFACAQARKESRGAHYRSDFPEKSEDFACASIVSYDEGKHTVTLDRGREYEG